MVIVDKENISQIHGMCTKLRIGVELVSFE